MKKAAVILLLVLLTAADVYKRQLLFRMTFPSFQIAVFVGRHHFNRHLIGQADDIGCLLYTSRCV